MTTPAALAPFDLDRAWRPHPQVAVRPEPFGALLYHFGTRRLSFLKQPVLREVLDRLADQPDARSACVAAGVPGAPGQVPEAVLAALGTLAATGMIVPREAR